MIAAKQNTSIYKDGIEFCKEPISTGAKIVFLPKPKNKYDTVFTDYDKKKEHMKLSKQQKEHQYRLENDPTYYLENAKKYKKLSKASSTISYSASQKSMPSSLTAKSSKKSDAIKYWQKDPFSTTKHLTKSYKDFIPAEQDYDQTGNIFCTHSDFSKRQVNHVRPKDKPPVWGNGKNAPLWTMGDNLFFNKQEPPRGKKLNVKLQPWVLDDAFKRRLLADNRTGAIAKTATKNNICDDIYNQRSGVIDNTQLYQGVTKLKDLNLLKEFKVYQISHKADPKCAYSKGGYYHYRS